VNYIKHYIGNKNDDIDKIIENIQDYIEDYIEELIKYASPYEYSVGDIDSENITDLVTEDEFLEKFKEWYLNE
jgi:predicted AlkP superfamily pyrophosphatase or phosphodiesterase